MGVSTWALIIIESVAITLGMVLALFLAFAPFFIFIAWLDERKERKESDKEHDSNCQTCR